MDINHTYITNLIIKLLKGELLDEQEKQDLQRWLSANSRNQNFIQELKSYASIEEDIHILEQFDEDEAWEKFNHLHKKDTSKGFRYYLTRIAVVFTLFFATALLVYRFVGLEETLPTDNRVVQDKTGRYNNDVLPADNMAKLILSDGSTVSVEQNNVIVKDGVIHLQGSDDLIYQQDSESEPTYHTLVVPRASFFKVALSDGTKVWLNAMSQLHFPSTFKDDERRVILEGEGYFEVAENPQQPFYVEAAGTSVKVLGTHFNVNSYRRRVKTTLVEGKVEVYSGDDRQVLIPGQEAESDNMTIRIREADIDKTVAWKNGEFHFQGDDIAHIVNQLGRWYDLDVRFSRTPDMSRRYSGRISRSSTLTEVLEMLTHVSDFRFEIQGRSLMIRERRSLTER